MLALQTCAGDAAQAQVVIYHDAGKPCSTLMYPVLISDGYLRQLYARCRDCLYGACLRCQLHGVAFHGITDCCSNTSQGFVVPRGAFVQLQSVMISISVTEVPFSPVQQRACRKLVSNGMTQVLCSIDMQQLAISANKTA